MAVKINLPGMFDALKAVPALLLESNEARSQRNATVRRPIAPPPPGTPLLVSFAIALEHTGVYLGANRVAELECDGTVSIVSLSDFINGGPNDMPIRNGTRIFAACDAKTRKPLGSKLARATALKFSKSGFAAGYDFVRNNCHLFTAVCVSGLSPDDDAFKQLMGGGVTSIRRLEDILERELNDGRSIAWNVVARSKDKFNYTLTNEKIVRLRREGKL